MLTTEYSSCTILKKIKKTMNYPKTILQKELDQHNQLKKDYDNGVIENKDYNKLLKSRIKQLTEALTTLKKNK